MDSKLLELLVCPVSKTSLVYMREQQELWCRVSRLAYPINDDIPSLLPDEARTLTDADLELL
ncbi:Trm112 family protein [Pseudomonadales bacterium]|nr:Trm112 family protein [Pseudomonadales bacterium]MDA7785383.1 Trm112 family protein [Pseudomonadales bacterium]MDA8702834.1 Trm112 family protein [Pseudomonadales bacterium]MDA8953515.1 Trm112 family protein [Pseudomonadales bacterium]MDA9256555.1 Trm112 family protein [Pseudomonadales bacterium]